MPEENSPTILATTAQRAEQHSEKLEILTDVASKTVSAYQAAPTFEEAKLRVLDVSDVKAVQQVTDLMNCGKNIPYALAAIAIKKALSYLSAIPITGTALDLIQVLTLIQRIWEQYQLLLELIEMLKDPETLLMMLANAKILGGQSLLDKIDDIKSKFPEVPGLDGVLENLNELDLCNAELSLDSIFGTAKKIPMDKIPEVVKSFGKSLIKSESYAVNNSKDGDYASLMFKIREGTLKDDTFLSEIRKNNDTTKLSQYNQMLSLVNVLGYSLHDDLKKTGDTSQHASFKQKYLQNVETELAKYSNTWSPDIIEDYKKRTSGMGASLTSNTKIVNEYYNRNLSSSSGASSSDYGGISKTAFDMIVYYEVGGESAYNSRYKKPIWPGGASGITIGIGYDIGYNTAAGLSGDWSGKISDSDISRLSACVGVKGSSAKAKLSSVSDIVIPWSAALEVYKTKTLPRFIKETLRAFPNADKLSPDAFGALVSLVFNRGGSTSGPRREEMANIRKALTGEIKVDNIYTYIADQIVAMKRVWANSNLPGLLVRRDKEASFVRSGASSGGNVA
jgi:GH24 family phage-related lysozyme (muramidase)